MFLLVSLLLIVSSAAGARVALIHMHGVMEGYYEHNNFKNHIERNHGIDVHLIDAFNYISSNTPIAEQVPVVRGMVQEIAENYDHLIVVGYSQGGVIMRGVIESWTGHNIAMFISLASPQHGVYGAPPLAEKFIPFLDWYSRTGIYKLIYTWAAQKFGMFNYYLDPTHYEMYLDSVEYFPLMNNEREGEEGAEQRKENFSRLRKLVLIGGPDEDVIDPWQSTQFGYYTEQGFDGNIIPMEKSRFYREDLFGLRTLAESGRVARCTYDGINHLQFRDHKGMLATCVMPVIAGMLEELQ